MTGSKSMNALATGCGPEPYFRESSRRRFGQALTQELGGDVCRKVRACHERDFKICVRVQADDRQRALLDVTVFPRLQPTFGRGQIRELKIPGGVAMNWSVRPPIRIAVPSCINPEVDAGAGDRARTLRCAFHDSACHVIRASRRAWKGVRSDRCGWGSGGRRRRRRGWSPHERRMPQDRWR